MPGTNTTKTNGVIETMLSHRSIRRYAPEAIPDEDIRLAVEAGQAASTSSAIQSYCVIHVTDVEKRRALAELCGPQKKVELCGGFFVICGDTRRHRLACARVENEYDARFEAFVLAAIDASLFAQNMALALESMGYGICYIGGLRNDLSAIDAVLALPEGVYPLFGLCAGIAEESPSARPRLPVEGVLFENGYAEDEEVLGAMGAYDDAYRAYLRERGAEERGWSRIMGEKFASPRRTSVGPYYVSKGADLR